MAFRSKANSKNSKEENISVGCLAWFCFQTDVIFFFLSLSTNSIVAKTGFLSFFFCRAGRERVCVLHPLPPTEAPAQRARSDSAGGGREGHV